MTRTFDLVVIGSGTAARTVASPCREAGWTVAMIDKRPFGGTCALRGCDPKKVLVGVASAAEAARPDDWMRNVAREMNLSETAFLVPRDGDFDLRWLTPTVEVDLCGHATVASAHVLWQDGHLPTGRQARFHTRSGLLTADRRGDWIELDFPVKHATAAEPPVTLLPALGVSSPVAVSKNAFDYLVEVESEEELRRLTPDHATLRRIPVRGVIVTARSTAAEFDFVSRFFAPGSGIDEDPVTGSAHTALGPYWAAKLGKADMTGYQASSRGGVVRVRLNGERVVLCGQAVTVMRATLLA